MYFIKYLADTAVIILVLIIGYFLDNTHKTELPVISSNLSEPTIVGGNLSEPTIVGEGRDVILVPGLGNGIESYNWNLSTDEQRAKTGIVDPAYQTSLQQKIAAAGYRAITFDTPGVGRSADISIDSFDDYARLIRDTTTGEPPIIVGHSIGARVAQRYAEMYPTAGLILLDPTPEYIIDEMNYTKHLTDPKYLPTYNFIQAAKNSIPTMPTLQQLNTPVKIIVSYDTQDPMHERKREYFKDIPHIALENATHWLHITHPDTVLQAINDIMSA